MDAGAQWRFLGGELIGVPGEWCTLDSQGEGTEAPHSLPDLSYVSLPLAVCILDQNTVIASITFS